jgi:dynein heavy chain
MVSLQSTPLPLLCLPFFRGALAGLLEQETEAVKDLAKTLALPCYVCNCGEGLDYQSMGATLSGVLQVGAWGCFNEFNRINVEVLSVVSSQLKAIHDALLNDVYSVFIGMRSSILVKQVKGFVPFGIFITMNPGYAGRTELPQNLEILFRPVTMITPDIVKIAEKYDFFRRFCS